MAARQGNYLVSCRCIATVDLRRRGGCLHCSEGLDDRVLVHRSGWDQPRIPGLEVERLSLQIEPCSARDYVSYGLVLPLRGSFELTFWFLNPEAHRDALSCNKILLTHFASRRRT